MRIFEDSNSCGRFFGAAAVGAGSFAIHEDGPTGNNGNGQFYLIHGGGTITNVAVNGTPLAAQTQLDLVDGNYEVTYNEANEGRKRFTFSVFTRQSTEAPIRDTDQLGPESVGIFITPDDRTPPTVALAAGVDSFSQVTLDPFTVTATFSEPVTGFADGDLTASNAAVGPLDPAGGAGTVFTATITPAGTGDVVLEIAAGTALDIGRNGNIAADPVTVTQIAPPPRVNLAASPLEIGENGGTSSLTATLDRAVSTPTNVFMGYSGTATNGTDFTGAPIITIPGNQLSGSIVITGLDDTHDDDGETIVAEIVGVDAGVEAGDQQVSITIIDDDPPPAISVNDVVVDESAGTARFTISLDRQSNNVVTVAYATNDGTATSAGGDYVGASGTATFNPGNVSSAVDVAINEDDIDETDESFTIDLTGATNATIADAQGVATIVDNDDRPVIIVEDTDGTLIVSGDATPSTDESTDFGPVEEPGASAQSAYVIRNTGSIDLNITSVSSNAGQFVPSGGTSGSIPPGGSEGFTVTFDPDALGVQTATITIASDDPDTPAYTFAVQGEGIDSTAPGAPNAPDLTAASDSGPANDDDITNVALPVFTGTAEPDALVALTSDIDGAIDTATADAGTGAWSITVGAALSEATHEITATASDASGNQSPPSEALTVTIDRTQPGVTAFVRTTPTNQITNADTLVFTARFSEAVADVGSDDFAVTGPSGVTVSTSSDTGTEIAVTLAAGNLADFNGTVGLDLAASQNIIDLAGNALVNAEPPTDETYELQNDVGPPVVQSIALLGTPGADQTSISFRVTFDENANSVSPDDFILTATGTASGAIASVSASSGTVVDVVIDTIAGDGTLRLDLRGDTDITDDLSNGDGNNGFAPAFTSGEVHNVDRIAPSVAILGAPDSLDDLTPFAVTILFSSAVFDFAVDGVVVGNGSASNLQGMGASYTVLITPSGGGDVGIDVPAGVARDEAGNGNLAAETVVVVNRIAQRTSEVIARFLQSRAGHILNNQPDLAGFLNGTGRGHLNAQGDDDGMTLNFAARLGGQAPGAGDRIGDTIQETKGRYDVWAQVSGALARTDAGDSGFAVGHFGAHYFVSPDLLIGAMVSVDWTDYSEAEAHVEGIGWMVGPYLVAQMPGQPLFLEARAAWGRSDNDVAPLGTYEDAFTTERWLASAELSGDFDVGDFTITPSAAISYFEERQDAYTDSLGNFIPEQTVSVGELRFGSSLAHRRSIGDGIDLRVKLGLAGIWNFAFDPGAAPAARALPGTDQWRARIDGELALTDAAGRSLAANGYFDGLGANDYEAWGAELKLTVPIGD